MSINVSEVIWTVICFFVLLYVLKKFLFTPLITFMEDRKARIEAGLAESREAKRKQEEQENTLRENWQERSDKAKQLVSDGKAADEKAHAEHMRKAQMQAAQAESDAYSRIEQETAEVRKEADEKMDEMVTELTQQLLQKTAE